VSESSDSESETPGKRKRRRKEDPKVKLKHDSRGYPILPDLEEINGRSLLYRKRVIGEFISEVYSSWAVDPYCRLIAYGF
jgi:hypothetical protein